MFDLSFDEIAGIVERTPAAARQLASRARRRVRGAAAPAADVARSRALVIAFLAASRAGDFQRLIALLSPDALLRADELAIRTAGANQQQGAPALSAEVRGAVQIANAFSGKAGAATPALINGSPGAVWAMGGQVRAAFVFTFARDKIAAIDLIMNPTHLARLDTKLD
jgi:RNA polymerase sigma-70 factor (ECF subfamily)